MEPSRIQFKSPTSKRNQKVRRESVYGANLEKNVNRRLLKTKESLTTSDSFFDLPSSNLISSLKKNPYSEAKTKALLNHL